MVEDEWEREIESDEDLDLLFVKYDSEQITIEELLKTITAFGFKAEYP